MTEASGRPVGILVLGMHRSGTSAITGVLEKLGIPVPGEMMPPAPDNPKGFFENKAAFDFNHKLLNHFQSRWDDPLAIALEGFEASGLAAPFEAELEAIVRAEFLEKTPVFALKDPSLCRFVPLWRRVLERLDVAARVVVAVRHPAEVAGSLAVRDGLPRAKTFLVWLQHMLPAERQTRGMVRTFLPYAGLMADWRGATAKLSGDLGLAFPTERARAEAGVDTFLSRDLRHHVAENALSGEDGAATGLETLTARAFAAFQALAHNRDDAGATAELDRVWEALGSTAAVFGPYVAWEFKALLESRERVAWLEEIERVVRAESASYFQTIAELNGVIADERASAATAASDALEERHAALAEAAAASAEALAEAAEETKRLRAEDAAFHRQVLVSEQRAFRQALDRATREAQELRQGLEGELHALRQNAERGAFFERRAGDLENEMHHWRGEAHHRNAELSALRASAAWRLTAPFRHTAGRMPPSMRALLRRFAKAGWWAATPWRMPARLRFLEERRMRLAAGIETPAPGESGPIPPALAALPTAEPPPPTRRGSHPALGLFEVASGRPRVSMVTDSINEGSLFGGVATALIFTALLARRTGQRLRIVTRQQAPAAENVAAVFRAHGIDWTDNIEFVFADIADPENRIETQTGELFVTTSWWTTVSTRQSVADERIVYILQEDERMFYPFGDDQLACAETISDRRIAKVINSGLLHRHLAADGTIDASTPFFEPSFPERIYFPGPEAENEGKRNFFFYARPYNARNLYERGVAVIETAIERGILDPALWNIHFVGKDLKPMRLAGGVEPILLQNLAWEDYAAFVRSVDLALTLMYTPHPSYPPLDVAACGGVAVTNRFGVKTNLSHYSRSILCVDSELETLVEGLRQGIEKALDRDGRRQALADSGLKRDWATSFAPVLDHLMEGTLRVR